MDEPSESLVPPWFSTALGSGTLKEGVAKGLRGPKGRKGRKGKKALRGRFWQPEKSSGGYLASLTSLTSLTLSTFSTLLRHPLKGWNKPAPGAGLEVPRVAEFISPFQGFSAAFDRDPGFRPGLAALVRGCTLGWRISPIQGLGKLPPLESNRFFRVRSSEVQNS